MKKTLLAIALAAATLGVATAHPMRTTHYHDGNQVVIGNTIAPKTQTTYETDRHGRRIRVVTTTTCVETRVNRRNNHLRCVEQETETTRMPDRIGYPHNPDRAQIEPRVQRFIERDNQGRRVIVTITDTCTRAGYNSRGAEVCYNWERDIDRQYVRRQRGSFDLNGDGRSDRWERELFEGFREILEDNNN